MILHFAFFTFLSIYIFGGRRHEAKPLYLGSWSSVALDRWSSDELKLVPPSLDTRTIHHDFQGGVEQRAELIMEALNSNRTCGDNSAGG